MEAVKQVYGDDVEFIEEMFKETASQDGDMKKVLKYSQLVSQFGQL